MSGLGKKSQRIREHKRTQVHWLNSMKYNTRKNQKNKSKIAWGWEVGGEVVVLVVVKDTDHKRALLQQETGGEPAAGGKPACSAQGHMSWVSSGMRSSGFSTLCSFHCAAARPVPALKLNSINSP